MPKSDFSLEDLEEGEVSNIRVVFETGDSRELKISKREAETLIERGSTVSPWYTRAGRKLSRPLGWILALIIGSLLIPAITKQWTDRPKELELKNSLITQITDSSTTAIQSYRFLAVDILPENRIASYHYELWQSAKPSEKDAAWKKYQTSRDAAAKAEQKLWIDTSSSWETKKAAIEAQLNAYFPETTLPLAWSSYAAAVRDYGDLSTESCGDSRRTTLKRIQAYFDGTPAVDWNAVFQRTSDVQCKGTKLPAYRSAYTTLGDQLSKKREVVLRSILRAQASGFSSGWRDLLNDLI